MKVLLGAVALLVLAPPVATHGPHGPPPPPTIPVAVERLAAPAVPDGRTSALGSDKCCCSCAELNARHGTARAAAPPPAPLGRIRDLERVATTTHPRRPAPTVRPPPPRTPLP